MLEWLKEPGFFGTHATVGADMSQLMATFFTGLFVIGWIQAKSGHTCRIPAGCGLSRRVDLIYGAASRI